MKKYKNEKEIYKSESIVKHVLYVRKMLFTILRSMYIKGLPIFIPTTLSENTLLNNRSDVALQILQYESRQES